MESNKENKIHNTHQILKINDDMVNEFNSLNKKIQEVYKKVSDKQNQSEHIHNLELSIEKLEDMYNNLNTIVDSILDKQDEIIETLENISTDINIPTGKTKEDVLENMGLEYIYSLDRKREILSSYIELKNNYEKEGIDLSNVSVAELDSNQESITVCGEIRNSSKKIDLTITVVFYAKDGSILSTDYDYINDCNDFETFNIYTYMNDINNIGKILIYLKKR